MSNGGEEGEERELSPNFLKPGKLFLRNKNLVAKYVSVLKPIVVFVIFLMLTQMSSIVIITSLKRLLMNVIALFLVTLRMLFIYWNVHIVAYNTLVRLFYSFAKDLVIIKVESGIIMTTRKKHT